MSLEALLEEEWYHVRHSGELPEVALHASFYHLSEDPHGPRVALGKEGQRYLLQAARERYVEIILRDLAPDNRDLSGYRGLARAICNWHRFKSFSQRHGLAVGSVRLEMGRRLRSFLEQETEDVRQARRRSSINCSLAEIEAFATELRCSVEHLHDGLRLVCAPAP